MRVGKDGFWNSLRVESLIFEVPLGWRGWLWDFIEAGESGFWNSFGLEGVDFGFHLGLRGWLLEFLEG